MDALGGFDAHGFMAPEGDRYATDWLLTEPLEFLIHAVT